jgi:hypothetical protein
MEVLTMRARKSWIWSVLVVWVLAATALPVGCERRGPAERAGRDIDRGMEDAGDAIQDLGRDIEDAGRGRR